MLQRASHAELEPPRRQMAQIRVAGGYQPSTIMARADVPLRLVFDRDDGDACSERVIFGTPRLERRLAPHGRTTVDLPAWPAGEVRFTCGMGRYQGLIKLEPAPSSIVAELRSRLLPYWAPLAMASILWICALPLIAILAVLAFDITAVLAASLAALIVLVAGCLWTFGRSGRSTRTTWTRDDAGHDQDPVGTGRQRQV